MADETGLVRSAFKVLPEELLVIILKATLMANFHEYKCKECYCGRHSRLHFTPECRVMFEGEWQHEPSTEKWEQTEFVTCLWTDRLNVGLSLVCRTFRRLMNGGVGLHVTFRDGKLLLQTRIDPERTPFIGTFRAQETTSASQSVEKFIKRRAQQEAETKNKMLCKEKN